MTRRPKLTVIAGGEGARRPGLRKRVCRPADPPLPTTAAHAATETDEPESTLLERGVWKACVKVGGQTVLYATTSAGEKFAEVRMVPGLDEGLVYNSMRIFLDMADPVAEKRTRIELVR